MPKLLEFRRVLFRSLSLLLAPNANSLHRLYRDRLSKAFLFDPTRIEGRRSGTGFKRESVSVSGLALTDRLKYEDFELAPIDRFKLSQISWVDTPFHLINTALNIQGSKYADRGGWRISILECSRPC